MINTNKYREFFPHTKDQIYFNHAAVSPLPSKTVETMYNFLQDRHLGRIEFHAEILKKIEGLRTAAARLVHAPADRIAFTKNTSEGLNILASGLEFQSGDRVLITDYEFPANVYPWINLERKGVIVDYVKNREGRIFVDDIEKMITPKTKILSISFVQFSNGFRNDMEAIGNLCKDKEIIFSVDAIQAAGVIPIDVEKFRIDFLSTGGHKWLMSPSGTGFLYLTEELQNRIHQAYLGWMSTKTAWHFLDYQMDLLDTAARYEIANQNYLGLYGMFESIKLLLEVGIENIERHVLKLTDLLIEELAEMNCKILSPLDAGHRSGIVLFSVLDDNQVAFESLKEQKIILSLRNGSLRASPHFYNSAGEITELVARVKSIIENKKT